MIFTFTRNNYALWLIATLTASLSPRLGLISWKIKLAEQPQRCARSILRRSSQCNKFQKERPHSALKCLRTRQSCHDLPLLTAATRTNASSIKLLNSSSCIAIVQPKRSTLKLLSDSITMLELYYWRVGYSFRFDG